MSGQGGTSAYGGGAYGSPYGSNSYGSAYGGSPYGGLGGLQPRSMPMYGGGMSQPSMNPYMLQALMQQGMGGRNAYGGMMPQLQSLGGYQQGGPAQAPQQQAAPVVQQQARRDVTGGAPVASAYAPRSGGDYNPFTGTAVANPWLPRNDLIPGA